MVLAIPFLFMGLMRASISLSSAQQFTSVGGSQLGNNVTLSIFDDEFNATSLNTRWTWFNEDPDLWSLTESPGSLRIIGIGGDMAANCNNPGNLLTQSAPNGDFEITTKIWIEPSANYEQAGLILFSSTDGQQDLDNYVKMSVTWNSWDGGTNAHFAWEQSGVLDWMQPMFNISQTQPAYLKLTKQGNEYSGYYSTDGEVWIRTGFTTLTTITNPRIGVYSLTGIAAATPPVSCALQPSSVIADFDYFRVSTLTGKITSPSDNITIGPLSLLFWAEASTSSPNGISQVEFLVYYNGIWHSAGIDSNYPYQVVWQTPAQLRSEQLRFGIHVTDNDNNTAMFAGGVHRVNFVESIGNLEVTENWIPTRAYLNQRSLQPNGDSKCSAASMAMVLAMNGSVSIDYVTMRDKANEMYPKVLNAVGDAHVGAMVTELERQGLTAATSQYSTDNGWSTLQQEIDAGRPVIVRTAHGVVTSAGHFFVAVGYRETNTSREVITYDPFGRWLGTCCTNNYNRNTIEAESHLGQWVFYDFDDAFGNSNWLITAQHSTDTNNRMTSDDTPASPPDVVSNEPENIGTYIGVNTQVDTRMYLPLVSR